MILKKIINFFQNSRTHISSLPPTVKNKYSVNLNKLLPPRVKRHNVPVHPPLVNSRTQITISMRSVCNGLVSPRHNNTDSAHSILGIYKTLGTSHYNFDCWVINCFFKSSCPGFFKCIDNSLPKSWILLNLLDSLSSNHRLTS